MPPCSVTAARCDSPQGEDDCRAQSPAGLRPIPGLWSREHQLIWWLMCCLAGGPPLCLRFSSLSFSSRRPEIGHPGETSQAVFHTSPRNLRLDKTNENPLWKLLNLSLKATLRRCTKTTSVSSVLTVGFCPQPSPKNACLHWSLKWGQGGDVCLILF